MDFNFKDDKDFFKVENSTINENELADFNNFNSIKNDDSSSFNESLNNNYISQSLSSSIPIKQSLAKALPSGSESFNENKIHKVASTRRKSAVKNEEASSSLISSNSNATSNSTGNNNGEGSGYEDEDKKKDNINEKIQEILQLIPRDYFEDNKDRSSGTKDGKPNKGQILTKGVEYIQDLQNKIDENNRKEVELILKLKNLSILKNTPIGNDINVDNTSAEVVLGEIGVGPLAGMVAKSEEKKTPNNNFEFGGYGEYA